MYFHNILIKSFRASLPVAIITFLLILASPVSAQPDAPALVQSIHATVIKNSTIVDIALRGGTVSHLVQDGNRMIVTLKNATAAPNLTQNMTGGGFVSGINLDTPDGNKLQSITLILRTPASGKIVASPYLAALRVAIGTPQDLARLAKSAPVRTLCAAFAPKNAPVQTLVPVETPMPASEPVIIFAPEPSLKAAVFFAPAAPAIRTATPAPAIRTATPAPAIRTATPAPVLHIAMAIAEPPLQIPARTVAFAPALPRTRRLYNVNAYQSDLGGVLNSLAQDAHVSVVMAGPVSSKVTMSLHQVTLEKAVDLLTRSCGLGYHQDGSVFVVGAPKDLMEAYPKAEPVIKQAVYRCVHVSAADVAAAIQSTFDKDALRVSVGAAPSSPRLSDASTSSVTGVQASTMRSGDTGQSANTHLVIIAGEESVVAQALDLARQLDVRRTQVKIGVQITDVNRNALKNLGLQWNFGSIGIHESQPNGIGFGSFTRDPLSVSASLSALEDSGNAKLLAAPNMSLLDGEKGYILIGDRIQYPKLTGYTQAQTPIYDITEERVGIYLQVAVQMEDNGEMTLTIYPQVSTVTGYLNVNGARYPQISTREQQTTIRVKDGQQIVVGGLIRDEEISSIQRVPLLSRIPLFGELFTYRNSTKLNSEVVIIITPQVLKD